MKKLFLSIIALLLGFCLSAQTVIIGAGATSATASNGTTGDCGPMYRSSATSNFVYSTHHYLYTQSELSTAGIPLGAVITNLAWNKADASASNSNFLFQIWMKNSALTTVQAPPQALATLTTGSTSVYNSSATALTTTIGYVDFTLTTPFVYTGGALEITVNFDMSSGSSPWTTAGVAWTRDPMTDRTLSYVGSTPNTTLSNLRTVRPQLRITYSATPPCASPTGLAATGVTQAGANVSWHAVSGSIGYEYVVNQNPADPVGAGTFIPTTGTLVGGLAPVTTYYLHVRNQCGPSSFSAWETISFTTVSCPVVTAIANTAMVDMCEKGTATVSFTHTGNALNYQWQIKTASTGVYVDLPNAFPYAGVKTNTLDILEAPNTLHNTLLRCIVEGQCNTIISADIPVTVVMKPYFFKEPEDINILPYENAWFESVVYGPPGNTLYWQSSGNGVDFVNINDNSLYSGSKAIRLVVFNAPPSLNGMKFRCILKSNNPTCAEMRDTTEAVKLNIGFPNTVNMVSEKETLLHVYPNPVTDNTLYLSATGMAIGAAVSIEIHDVLGKILYTENVILSADNKLLLPSEMTPGIYSVRIQGKNIHKNINFIRH